MAYATIYRAEFKDVLGLLWRVDIELNGWSGGITNFVTTGEPLTIEMLNNGDDWVSASIHGSTVKLGVYAYSDFQWTALYNGIQLFRMSVYYGASYTLYWRGFLDRDGYEENYDMVPYPVTIKANDGLGMLKTMPFKYTTTVENDTYYNFRQTEAYILNEIFNKINITSWKEFINIYESTMANGVGDSPLVQAAIDVDIFKDMNCYDVLEKILSKYDAVIVQDMGEMIIYRPVEINQATVYGRKFTSATAFTSTSMAPEQFISRSGRRGNFIIPEGGSLSLQTPLKKITINQDYGSKKSWIDVFEFNQEDYIPGTLSFSNWTNNTTNVVHFLGEKLPREKQGVLLLGTDATGYIYQDFALYALKTDNTNQFNFSFDYQYYNGYGSSFSSVTTDPAIQIKDSTGTYYLYEIDDEFCGWTNTPSYINIGNENPLKVGGNGWVTYSRKITGLPIDGSYQIRVYKGWSAVTSIGRSIRNVCLIATADTIIAKAKRKSRWSFSPLWTFGLGIGSVNYQISGKRKITGYSFQEGVDNEEIVENEYSVTNSIYGNETDLDRTIGDVLDSNVNNILEQFMGAISIKTLVNAATKFVTDWAASYLPGGVVVTSLGKVITFEASTAGIDFTGSTTITNTTGDLTGTVANVVANSSGTTKIIDITFSGSSGAGMVFAVDIYNRPLGTITYSSSISTTINNFISNHGLDFGDAGYSLSHPSTYVLRMTSSNNYDFDGQYMKTIGTLEGSISTYRAFSAETKRKDTIALSGTNGTANILCDGVTKLCSMVDTKSSGVWNTRQFNNEAKPLLEILGDSIRKQYSRPTHLLSLPMIEQNYTTNEPILRLCFAMRDDLNLDPITGEDRYFFMNGTQFDVKNRQWKIDMIEIITEE